MAIHSALIIKNATPVRLEKGWSKPLKYMYSEIYRSMRMTKPTLKVTEENIDTLTVNDML